MIVQVINFSSIFFIQLDKVKFETMMNPLLRIGGLMQLESLYDKRFNGIYKINTIHYTGDYSGSDWKQEILCIACNDYRVVK